MREELNKINDELFSKMGAAADTFKNSPDFFEKLIQETIDDWGDKLGASLKMKEAPKFDIKMDKKLNPPLKIIPLNDSAKEIIDTAKDMKLTDLF
jgi:hypothetical protein